MTATEDARTELAWHLRGNFAPVPDETTLTDLTVEGTLPPELDGLYVRNGSNPANGPTGHWFFGNGMLHGVRLSGGQAQWYRNRYVKTPALDGADALSIGDDGSVDRISSLANTHVVCHAGRILALEEGHFPWEVDARLETVGPVDFGGRLTSAFTAHPKLCPETGEMLAFGYGFLPPYLTYLRVSATGELVQATEIPVPGPTMIHDFNVTRNHVIFMDLPVVFDLELAMQGTMPYRWDDDYGARLGVMPRDGSAADLRWYDVDPCYVFHPMNAFEEGGRIVLDVCRYPSMWRKDSSDFALANLHRWTIDPVAGTVGEQPLDDRPVEFARVGDASVGLGYRYGYAAMTAPANGEAAFNTKLVKYDHVTGAVAEHECGAGRRPGEAVFAASPGATSEDDGYVITFAFDEATGTSDLVVVDARHFTSPPVAKVKLPRRVPFGFHGSWVPASSHPGLAG